MPFLRLPFRAKASPIGAATFSQCGDINGCQQDSQHPGSSLDSGMKRTAKKSKTLWHSARPAKVRVTMGLEENLEGDVSWIRKSLECFYDTLLRCSVVLDVREIDFEILT
ncbi:hypothetical protein HZH68_004777 [Vespula germanica]|uniref:Uncharacterized protein n=1 Tax=Vespula germanica TaxID=30212 RepID=A0A834KR73_VESGE|nr:hypothetical protein HZH68_004777 [Vespula germanica]